MKDFVQVRIESEAFDKDSVHVAELTGKEAISRLFEYELLIATLAGELDEEALLTKPVRLIFERKTREGDAVSEIRRITGVVRSIRDRGLHESRHREYVVTVVPRAWHATLSSTSDVCMDISVPDIIKKKLLEGAGLAPGKDIELRLEGNYGPREFVVQYKETNFDFVCRLAEDLGIHFSFEVVDGRDVIVVADPNAALRPAEAPQSPFTPRGDRTDVYELESRRQLVSKSFVARDYNYRNPTMDVQGEAQAAVLGRGRVDEYGPHAKTPDEAVFYAKLRAEEAAARYFGFEGKSDLPGLRAGSLWTIEGHPRGDIEMVVTELTHELSQPVFGIAPARERPYANGFRGVPKASPYRPARITPKPVVHGVVTGIVESEAATEMGAIDEQGRYRVAFMYDSVSGRGDGKASRPLRMAQPSASAGRGFHAPLKSGTEVIVTCVNGDPDRPIIAGAVPNPQTASPVSSANAEKSMWTTNKSSIAIDDDKPRCKVSVAGEDHVLQIGHPNGPEMGILMETKENISERAKKVKTSYSKLETMLSEHKFGTASADILQAAGIPNPMSAWDKVQEAAHAFAELAQSVSAMADGVADMFEKGEQDAKADKKEADEALKKTREKAFEKLGQGKGIDQYGMPTVDAPKPAVVSNPDGTARYETQAEAEQRTFAEALKDPKNKKTADELDAAMKKSADAQKHVEDVHANTAEAATKDATDDAEEFLQDVEDKVEKAKGAVEKYGSYAEKVLAKVEKIKGVGPLIKKLSEKGAPLISKISSIFTKATQKALDELVKDAQKAGNAVPTTSGERNGHDVGAFASPHNIQLSRNSAALFGGRNAFVFGAKNVTMLSAASASLLARGRVDVKSTKLVEVAAKKVALSAKKEIDAYSDGTIAIVAKAQGVKVGEDSSIVINGQKDVHLVSDDKNLHIKANKNVSVLANEGNLVLTAKKGDFLWLAEEGKLELEVKKGTGKVTTKGKLEVATEDELHVSAKKSGTFKMDDALTLDCKDGHWKAGGDVDVKASGAVKVKATTIKISGKVELG